MNQLETNLTLWAICSIVLFEILIIICLCRCWFNRIRPKKFYVKRNEYEYLSDIHNGTQSKYQSTILRPPHSDELAHIGTIHVQDSQSGIQNPGFYHDDKDEQIIPVQRPLSQQWIELQPPMINTVQLPSTDFEMYPYSTDDYTYRQPPIPRPTIIDFPQYDDKIESYRLQSLQRPDIIFPQVKRSDTSTEYYGMQYSNIVPKSILKTVTSTISPVDALYLQFDRSRTPSKNDESPQASIKMNTDQTYSLDRRFPMPSILSPISPAQMNFAYVSHLSDIQWETPGEFQTIFQRSPPTMSWPHPSNANQIRYGNIAQQQAFEY